ncbi:hypothetical protein C2S51_022853 [Perilla frutescens var. frutescens]|nr:hypothetical protein C2S51_022853 [Perilla frutescens var. frutescens]
MAETATATGGEKELITSSSKYVVGSVPTVLYIPEYVSAAEEEQLLKNIYQAPLSKWKSLKNRRLQNWTEQEELFTKRVFSPKIPHQDGPAYMPVVAILSLGSPVVMDFVPHTNLRSTVEASGDNSKDIISGPSHMEMSSGENFSKDHLPFSVVLMPRSLLIFKDIAYSDYLHGIKDSEDHRYDEAR